MTQHAAQHNSGIASVRRLEFQTLVVVEMTQTPGRRNDPQWNGLRQGRWAPARTVRSRLGWLVAGPLLLSLLLLSLSMVGQFQASTAARETSAAVDATLSVQELIHHLQRERGLTNGILGGETSYRSALRSERRSTDTAAGQARAHIADSDLRDRVELGAALSALEGLASTRSGVDSGIAVRNVTFSWYTERISALNGLDLGLSATSDRILGYDAHALRALGAAKEAAAQLRGLLNGVFAVNRFSPGEYAQFAAVRAERDAALAEFRGYATTEQRVREETALRSGNAVLAARYEQTAAAGYDVERLGVSAQAWWTAMTAVIDDLRLVQQAVGNDAGARAAHLQQRSGLILALLGGIALSALIGGTAVALLAARTIARPLASIAAEASDIALRRLPAAVAAAQSASMNPQWTPPALTVPPRATTEMRAMAGALSLVQDTAVSLATEQAVLRRNTTASLVNLGRRNQNLLRRQLGFISRLESEEADPTALANLFELDHLATRMRRNAESLLVLVGESSPRGWSASVAMADVIRAATAEVEDYRRVALRRLDDGLLAGARVAELAHILAELLENALTFSPPDVDVELFGRRTRDHYLVAIIDYGVGMSETDLASANARLRGEQQFLAAPARFLGHYVVGALAERLGVEVSVSASPVSGVTALVTVPIALLVDPTALDSDRSAATAASLDGRVGPAVDVEAMPDQLATPDALTVTSAATTASGDRVIAAAPVPGRWLLGQSHPHGSAAVPRDPHAVLTTKWSQGTDGPDGSRQLAHTRNGLEKRVRRVAETGPPPRRPAATTDPIDRAPAEVGAMLSSLRAGMERGWRRSMESDSADHTNKNGV